VKRHTKLTSRCNPRYLVPPCWCRSLTPPYCTSAPHLIGNLSVNTASGRRPCVLLNALHIWPSFHASIPLSAVLVSCLAPLHVGRALFVAHHRRSPRPDEKIPPVRPRLELSASYNQLIACESRTPQSALRTRLTWLVVRAGHCCRLGWFDGRTKHMTDDQTDGPNHGKASPGIDLKKL
jgi:hypothetical protein